MQRHLEENKMAEGYCVAIVGATGAVGTEMLAILEERNFPVSKIVALASERSLGKNVTFNGDEIPVEVLNEKSFEGVQFALFSAGGAISKQFAPIAAKSGAIVIDNTSAFRMERDIPLVVPEVNPHALDNFRARNIIANPNCSTIQMVVALAPLHDEAGIKRIVVSTYQAVSGAGYKAMDELSKQSVELFSEGECKVEVFQHRIAFNVIPQIGKFLEDGSTEEEAKMVNETKKIFGDDSIGVCATAVRVPVFCGHSEAVNVEFEDQLTPERAKALLSDAAGVALADDPSNFEYPMPIVAGGRDEVFVGRIRKDPSVENGLSMWIVADNLRKGAALNAIQIAELIVRDHM